MELRLRQFVALSDAGLPLCDSSLSNHRRNSSDPEPVDSKGVGFEGPSSRPSLAELYKHRLKADSVLVHTWRVCGCLLHELISRCLFAVGCLVVEQMGGVQALRCVFCGRRRQLFLDSVVGVAVWVFAVVAMMQHAGTLSPTTCIITGMGDQQPTPTVVPHPLGLYPRVSTCVASMVQYGLEPVRELPRFFFSFFRFFSFAIFESVACSWLVLCIASDVCFFLLAAVSE